MAGFGEKTRGSESDGEKEQEIVEAFYERPGDSWSVSRAKGNVRSGEASLVNSLETLSGHPYAWGP